jgi:tetratricopeptide (TPR) repeat protein
MATLSRKSRIRRYILGALIAVHLVALWLYAVQVRQSRYLARVLDARTQWSDGHLDTAAELYRSFATDYPTFSFPTLLFRNYPSRARAWYALGRVQTERGQIDAALAAYGESMREEHGLGQREYRNLLLEHGRYAQLAEVAHARLADDRADLSGWWDLAAADLGLDDANGATEAYREALAQLPRWQARHARASAGTGLSVEEGDLRGLLAVAALKAGERDTALANCSELGAREHRDEHYDQLCRGYLALADGDAALAARIVKGYQPPAWEHQRLLDQLNEALAAAGAAPAVGASR